jgi:hypothetical protein
MHRLPLFFVPGHDPVQAHLMKPGEYLVAVDGIAPMEVPECVQDQREAGSVIMFHAPSSSLPAIMLIRFRLASRSLACGSS